MKYILLALVCLLVPSLVFGAVLFSEDYDSISSNWNCSDSILSGFTGQATCSSDTYDSTSHYYGEVLTGGVTGNALVLWRHNGGFDDYGGYLDKDLTSVEYANHYKELYVRWYVKFDSGWGADLGTGHTHKLNRFYIDTVSGGKSNEFYMDIKGTRFSTGKFSFYITASGDTFYSEKTISTLGLLDGEWHVLEWHVKLNSSSGASDGVLEFFFDGEKLSICDGLGENCTTSVTADFGLSSSDNFTTLLPPAIGNLTDGSWDFPENKWYAVRFDNYVVSTTYIGPLELSHSDIGGNSQFHIGGNSTITFK